MNIPRIVFALSSLYVVVALLAFGTNKTVAQGTDNGIYLPIVSAEEAQEADPTPSGQATATAIPGDSSTATPTATATSPTIGDSVWQPIATATPTATPQRTYPDWIPGTYNVRSDKREGWSEFRADGTFSEQYTTFGVSGTRTYTGEWFVVGNEMVADLVDQNNVAQHNRFLVEQVDDGFRLTGGDFKLSSALFERQEPVSAVGGHNVSQWVRGQWSGIWGLTSYIFVFNEDGRYEIYQAFSFDDISQLEPDEVGAWSAWGNQFIIQPDGDTLADSTYTITTATRGFLEIAGGRYGDGDIDLLRKRYFPQTSMDDYEGQYIAGDMTMTVGPLSADSYAVQILKEGVAIEGTGALVDGGRLQISMADERNYDPIQRHFNALHYDSFELPTWMTKISETALPTPQNHQGMWIWDLSFTDDTELWLLPDGRYVNKSGSLETRGTYSVTADSITYDPVCDSPYTRGLAFAGDQMVQTSSSSTFTYHYVPIMLPDMLAAMAKADEQEAQANADFAAAQPVAIVNPALPSPVGGEVSVDVNRAEIYADATVFANLQLYDWFQEATYYLDNNGALISVLPSSCLFDNSICNAINYGAGSWKDKFHYYFYPNGRFYIYIETYYNATSISPVTPSIQRHWGKYKIENEVITGETDLGEAVEFTIVLGRRRIMNGETCIDNVTWVAED